MSVTPAGQADTALINKGPGTRKQNDDGREKGRCTDRSANYKSPLSTCEMRALCGCYAASALGEGCNSPTHQCSDGSSSDRKEKRKISYN
ncbi:hypothetical protein SK128_004521 [Halocaridina rubra]|uniref:Uncharacterized protein n=1 Tax=Halocaridina rubra TaxID=373956 RepID=A0AAN8ZXS5_HALRR